MEKIVILNQILVLGIIHLQSGLVWRKAFDWSVDSTAVTAMSSQLVDASRDFSIVGVRGTIERLDRASL